MTQGELEKIPIPLQSAVSELEIRIMTDIIRKIKENGFSSASTDWQVSRLEQLGMAERDIKRWIQEALELSDKEIEKVFSDDAYREYYGHERAYQMNGRAQIPFEDNWELLQLINAVKQQTKETFRNMTGSMGFAIRNPATGEISYSPLMEFYRDTLDGAILDIHSGAFSYNTVLERTIGKLTASGLRWIDYDSGWHNRVDVAARRAVMTGFRQVQGKINEQAAQELGTDRYEVTYHVGARPTHQPWQGRVWTMEELVSVCGLGTGPGLHGWNCYHDYRAFPPGSVRTYTDEQLDLMIKEENTPKTYKGRQYTTYEALQKQRRMETSMRATRQQIRLMKEGGADEEKIILKKARYQSQMQAYKDFSKEMKLPEQMARVHQDGLRGRFLPTKTELKKAGTAVKAENLQKPGSNIKMASKADGIKWPGKGTKVSNEEYKEMMEYARSKGIELSGFKRYDGEVRTVKEIVDDADSIASRYPAIKEGKKKLTIALDEFMDDSDFAVTREHIISINANAFRNTDRLAEEYTKLADSGWFVKGTDYHAIIKHETGHVVGNMYNINGLNIAEKITGIRGKELLRKVKKELSDYAGAYADGSEIISEVFSAIYGSPDHTNEFSLRFMEECDKIIKRR